MCEGEWLWIQRRDVALWKFMQMQRKTFLRLCSAEKKRDQCLLFFVLNYFLKLIRNRNDTNWKNCIGIWSWLIVSIVQIYSYRSFLISENFPYQNCQLLAPCSVYFVQWCRFCSSKSTKALTVDQLQKFAQTLFSDLLHKFLILAAINPKLHHLLRLFFRKVFPSSSLCYW